MSRAGRIGGLKRLIAIVALSGFCAGFVPLGFWQLDRAETNRALVERFDAAEALPALSVPVEDPEPVRFRKLGLRGRFLPEPQVLLDNRVRNGVVGYEVLTAFEAPGRDRLVVVNRGWVAARDRRDSLPEIPIDASSRAVLGKIDSLPRVGLKLGRSSPEPGRPIYVLSYPDYADLEAVLGRSVYPFQLLLDETQAAAYAPALPPPADRAMRNLAYAGQWFLLAVMAGAAALVMALRPVLARRAAES